MKRTKYLEVLMTLSISSLVFAQGPVHFSDARLKAAVEDALWLYDPTPADMLGLRELSCINSGVTDITGLEYAENLQTINLHLNQISDITPLAGLSNLRNLNLSRNQINGLSTLSGLSGLRSLDLHGNQLSSISALSGLANLESLVLRFNQLSNISALSGLTKLRHLSLHSNQLSDISALSELTKLETLLLQHNQISSISALSGLANLTKLYLSSNQLSDISALSGLTNLTKLYLSSNQLSDISAFSKMANLKELHLDDNQISNISTLSGLNHLATLRLSSNPIDRAACEIHIPHILANNPGVHIRYDPCISAHSPPSVVTYPAKNVSQTSATLLGYIINDGGDPACEFCFRWWNEGEPEPEPGDPTHQTEWKAKETHNGQTVFEDKLPEAGKPRLEPGCTYNYRAIAKNSAGPDDGGIAQFTTLTALYVDDNAATDPGPSDLSIGDPLEDGTEDHPFDSIQEAIEIARQHDTVFVREGTYCETINLMGKNIHLTGLNPDIPGITAYPIIDANGADTVLSFDHGEDPNCLLSGFVLTRGYGHPAGAILCSGSSPTIRNCLIVGNRCSKPNIDDPIGGIISCVDSSSVIENCTIADNYTGANGAGLCSVNSNVIVTNSILWKNLPNQILIASGDDPFILYSDIQDTWPGAGNIAADPLFARAGYWADPRDPDLLPGEPYDPAVRWIEGDYHLMSEAGRWDVVILDWVFDETTSPCIDAGDPVAPIGSEPLPNRETINLGAYGGTDHASKSLPAKNNG
jgi:Leucine-rich repeat (LRR) protein